MGVAIPMRLATHWITALFLMLYGITHGNINHAQASSPITSSGLNTQVNTSTTGSGQTQLNLTGGTRPGSGENLFHSFGNFNVPTNNVANFLNDSGIATSNILARVTGGSPSNIFGTIQTTGFGNANLFLMNPSGIIFGPTASLNVGGSVTFTTANYLQLADNRLFNARPNASLDTILSAAPVAAFGFLGSTATAIAVEGSTLRVPHGQTLSIVGGNQTFTAINPDSRTPISISGGVTLTDGKLFAYGGQVNLVSVLGPGKVLMDNFELTPLMELGSIKLSQNTTVNVSDNSGGTVRIRSGNLLIDNSSIASNSINANGTPIAIDIKVADEVRVSTANVSVFTAKTAGIGNAGAIEISSARMNVRANPQDSLTVIDSHTSGRGSGGNVRIETRDLQVFGDPLGNTHLIDSGTIGAAGGHGGDVKIEAGRIEMELATVSSGNLVAQILGKESTGSAGNITISGETLRLNQSAIDTGAFSLSDPTGRIGRAGNITVIAQDVRLDASFLTAQGNERGGAIAITSNLVMLNNSEITTQTNFLSGGGIQILANAVELSQGSQLISNTGGDGNAGPVTITATDHLSFLEGIPNFRPTSVTTTSVGSFGKGSGHGGDVIISTPRLEMTSGARINTSTQSNGPAGNVSVVAPDSVFISGEFLSQIPEPLFNLGNIHSSGIVSSTVGGKCLGQCGGAGQISIITGRLNLFGGGQINSGTSSSGQGGNINIQSTDTINFIGTLTDSSPVGVFSRTISKASDAGSGGSISLAADKSITIQNGATVSASSTGPGRAGDIEITAGKQLDVQGGSITTQSNQLNGGNITLRATDLVKVVDGQISTSAINGGGNGGTITIDPKVVLLQSSEILAQAKDGNGGSIKISTPLFLKDQASLVNADSQFGLNGTVTIQSPISNLSGTVGQLVSKTSPPQVLLQNRCVALAGGEQSTFILSGREALPAEPGGWLSSPVSMEHWTQDDMEHASALIVRRNGPNELPLLASYKDKPPVLSLRRLTPPGFLVRAFATGSTGCPS